MIQSRWDGGERDARGETKLFHIFDDEHLDRFEALVYWLVSGNFI
jgi:hypothetical protein